MNFDTLIAAALQAREKAYAPYSHFQVGAALLTESGEIFTGCNVENLSFGLTVCAERNAVFAAVAAGHRQFRALAVVAASKTPVSPCGACRQVLAEFAAEIPVCMATVDGKRVELSLADLFPRPREGILGT